MARKIVQTLPERWRGTLINVSYDLKNRIFLTPDNLLALDGDPTRIDVGLPGFTDGINVYGGTSPQEHFRQTETPLGFHRTSFYVAEFDEEGHPAPDEVGEADEITPGKPVVKVFTAASGGYQPGVTRIAYAGVDRGGNWTALSPFEEITILPDERGYNIRAPFPNIPGDWAGIAVFLTDPDSGSTYWHQRTWDLRIARPENIVLEGPLRRDQRHPGSNGTFQGVTATPSASISGSSYALPAGDYKFWTVDVTVSGLALPSNPIIKPISDRRGREAISVSHGARAESGIGWMCFARQKDGRTYVVYPAGSNPEQPLPYGAPAKIYSYDPQTWPQNAQGNPVGWAVAQRDLPNIDNSGLDNPLDQLDAPVTYGGTGLHNESTAKRFWFSLTATIGGIEGPRGPAQPISVAAGQGVRVIIPKSVQKLRNAKLSETGSDGFPLDITLINPATGGTIITEPGQARVTTNTTAAGVTPAVATSYVPIDKTEDYRITGQLEISGYTNGNGLEAVLEEYSGEGTGLVRTTPLRLDSGLFSMSGVGVEEYDEKITADENFWHASTNFARVLHRTPTGANVRNLQWLVRELDFLEQEHKPEKAKKGDRNKNEPDRNDTSPEEPTPEGPDYSPRKPRRKKDPQEGRAKAEPDRPKLPGQILRTYGFEAGENISPLSLTRTPQDAFRISSYSDPGVSLRIGGTQVWHVEDTGTVANGGHNINAQIYHAETFPSRRSHLGVRPRVRFRTLLPLNTSVEIFQALDFSGTSKLCTVVYENLAGIHRLVLRVYRAADQTTPVYTRVITTGIVANDLFEFEPVIQGSDTKDGHIRIFLSKNGGAYQVVGDYDEVDWEDLSYQQYRFGICQKSVSTATLALDFDDVQTTEQGKTHFRDRDALGQVIYQGHWSFPKGHRFMQGVLPRTLRIAVKPDTIYAAGLFMRYTGVKGTQRPFYITLHRLDGSTIEVGSILGEDGAHGTQDWRDYVTTFVTPDDCYEIRIAGHDIGPGKYVFQEFCLSEIELGDLPFTVSTATNLLAAPDHAKAAGSLVLVRSTGTLPAPLSKNAYYWAVSVTEDSLALATAPGGSPIDITTPGSGTHYLIRGVPKRTGRRAAEGSIRQTLDTRTPKRSDRGPHMRRTWRNGGYVIEELPPETTFSEVFSSSPNNIAYRGPYSDLEDVPKDTYLEFFGQLTGNGFDTPVIANRSPFLDYELSDATLLREDGTEFPGGTILLGLQTPAYIPPVEVRERLDGRMVRHILAADVGEVSGFSMQIFTEEAFEEISNQWMKSLFRVEGRGRSVLIKPLEQIALKQNPVTQQRVDLSDGSRYYYVYGIGEASRCEVIEEERL